MSSSFVPRPLAHMNPDAVIPQYNVPLTRTTAAIKGIEYSRFRLRNAATHTLSEISRSKLNEPSSTPFQSPFPIHVGAAIAAIMKKSRIRNR